jgi:hypothetical protein
MMNAGFCACEAFRIRNPESGILNFESPGGSMGDDEIRSLMGWIVVLILGGVLYIAVLMIEHRLGNIQELLERQAGRVEHSASPPARAA